MTIPRDLYLICVWYIWIIKFIKDPQVIYHEDNTLTE